MRMVDLRWRSIFWERCLIVFLRGRCICLILFFGGKKNNFLMVLVIFGLMGKFYCFFFIFILGDIVNGYIFFIVWRIMLLWLFLMKSLLIELFDGFLIFLILRRFIGFVRFLNIIFLLKWLLRLLFDGFLSRNGVCFLIFLVGLCLFILWCMWMVRLRFKRFRCIVFFIDKKLYIVFLGVMYEIGF